MSVSPSSESFREAMSRLAGAVQIITSDGPLGRAGLAATAVCSVTDNPPTLLICLNRTGSATGPLLGNKFFNVNMLNADQLDVASAFGGKRGMDERFATGAWSVGSNGAPVLAGCPVVFECTIAETIEQGSHTVIFGRVGNVLLGGAPFSPCLYFNRSYHSLPC